MPDFEPLPRPDPTTVTGYRAPTDQVSTRPVIDMADRILMYQPEATPLLTITGRIKGKRVTHNRKFEWQRSDVCPPYSFCRFEHSNHHEWSQAARGPFEVFETDSGGMRSAEANALEEMSIAIRALGDEE